MKVVFFEAEQWERETCLRLEPNHQVVCSGSPLNEQNVHEYSDAEAISPFIYSKLNAQVLSNLPKLKMIATRSTGYDHIDVAHCDARKIRVCNVPDYGDSTVAEHVFALLLQISRHISESLERTRRGVFHQSNLRGFELHGKTLGVIGTGRIGRRVIEIAKGFGMNVAAVDVQADEAVAQRLGFQYVSLDEALRGSDILTLHVPATPQTHHLLSDREFALMRPGATLINTARGAVVDIAALVRALADGRLSAAGLDVLPEEPTIREEAEIFRLGVPADQYDLKALVANHVLLRFPNVFVTPHNAYNTNEAVARIIHATLENIEAFSRGERRNAVGKV